MDLARAPAVVPAVAFTLGLALARGAAVAPGVGALATLAALGVALGRSGGRGLAAAALGALTALAAPAPLHLDPTLVAEVLGRTGSPRRGDHGALSVPLVAERLAQGGRVERGRLELRLDLPPGLPPPPPGSLVRARGAVGRSSGFANERDVGPGPWSLRAKSSFFVETLELPGGLGRILWRWRSRVREIFARAEVEQDRAGLRVARSLLFGEPEALGPAWTRALRRTGLGHLVAVSGLHVSLIGLLAALLTAPAGRSVRRATMAAAVLAYLALVGGTASVLRASAMSLLALAGLAARRAPEARQGLAWVLVALLLEDPDRISQIGFLLSFAATGGILALAPRWEGRFGRTLPRPLALGLAVTLAAQTASLPFSVAAFGELAPAAPFFNLLAAPWAAAVLASSLAWLAVAALWPAAGLLSAPLLDPLAGPLRALQALPASPWISLCWPGGWLAGVWSSALLMGIGEGGRVRRLAVLGALALVQSGHGPAPAAAFECLIFDVGQGDAALLRQGPAAFLVDGGGVAGLPIGLRVIRPALADRGIGRLRAVVVSHSDLDHCAGLVEIAGEIPIDEVWAPAEATDAPCSRELAATTGRPVRGLVAGDRLRRAGFRFEILHPARDRPGGPDNSSSLVLAVEAGGRRLLFAADIGAEQERELVLRDRDALRADLLKVPHHGSAGSSSAPFLVAVRPHLALVSAGARNGYGHPAAAALRRYRRLGIPLLRTDRDGGVALRWRAGEPWRIELAASPPARR